MFANVGWGEVLVIVVAGLFILGPERLPEAASWLGKTTRQVREYASGAREQLHSELGAEFEEFRKPLEDLRSLRDLNPRRAITKHLLDDYDPVEDLHHFDPRDDFRPDGTDGGHTGGQKPNGSPAPPVSDRLDADERPPLFDSEAT